MFLMMNFEKFTLMNERRKNITCCHDFVEEVFVCTAMSKKSEINSTAAQFCYSFY
jgi:hypothetical protein